MNFILLQGNEQEFKSNFEKRIEQLKAEGKQLLISLSTILSKVITYISFFFLSNMHPLSVSFQIKIQV